MSFLLIFCFHSLHRTPSQKTIATQLSIPISNSYQALGSNNASEGLSSGASPAIIGAETSTLPSITTTAPPQIQRNGSEAGLVN